MIGSRMPEYPRPSARGLKPLLNREERTPRAATITDLADSFWKATVQTVMSSGCGLLLSPTSDGGAISVTLYYGDDRAKDYASSPEELEAVLSAASDQAQAYDLGRTPTGPKKRPSTR